MPRIFISYRRADSQTITDRIHDRLREAFGADNVFQDVLGIQYGLDFREVLREKVHVADVLLVMIGPRWVSIEDADDAANIEINRPRLHDPDDFVRIEVEAGLLRSDVLVIPVLVNNASVPDVADLPESLQQLSYLNAATIRNNPYFEDDVTRLIERLRDVNPDGVVSRLPATLRLLAAGAVIALVALLAFFVLQSDSDSPPETDPTEIALNNQRRTATAAVVIGTPDLTETLNAIQTSIGTQVSIAFTATSALESAVARSLTQTAVALSSSAPVTATSTMAGIASQDDTTPTVSPTPTREPTESPIPAEVERTIEAEGTLAVQQAAETLVAGPALQNTINTLRVAFADEPENLQLYRELLTAYESAGNYDAALDLYRDINDLQVNNAVFEVVDLSLRIRTAPQISADMVGILDEGTTVFVVPSSRTEADGFVWWQHSQGWSVERLMDGSQVFMTGVETAALFERLPLNLNQIEWFQYYGNTLFAFESGQRFNYDGFSQGLHGGIDFGINSVATAPVYAGVYAVVQSIDPQRSTIRLRSGDYTIIYQGMTSINALQTGQSIEPNTILGEADGADLPLGIHIEVRYQDTQIINPLVLMPGDLIASIVEKFPVGIDTFYQSRIFEEWATPLDQPIIQLGGPLIGPRA